MPDDAHRATMQRVMLRMVSAEGGGELARRRVMVSELEYPTAEENVRVKTVLDRLVAGPPAGARQRLMSPRAMRPIHTSSQPMTRW